MFKKSVDDTDIENVGIMQGFMDEMEAEDELENDEDYQTEKMLDRRPDSPEILMNNLRGDMRSIDARVEELADLVGYNAAADTPEGVLALLQPVLAAQQAPQMPPMPPGMMPPPPMPPEGMMPPPEMPPEAAMGGIGALPADQGPMMEAPMGEPMPAPVAMAMGGYVQRFSDGSDEDGVTPSTNTSSFPAGSFSPDMINRARAQIISSLNQKPLTVPDISAQTESRIPLYEKLLGVDKNLNQAQILFELGQRAFNYGANVDDQGRPLRGSQAARLAGAVRTLPGSMGNIIGQQAQQDRAVRGVALQAAEKDVQNIREQNAKIAAVQQRLQSDILKSAANTPFGKGDWQWSIVNRPELLDAWSKGETDPTQSNLVESAITQLAAPRIETRTDPITKRDYTVTIPGILPPFVKKAMKTKGFTVETGGTGTVSSAPSDGMQVPDGLNIMDEFNQPTSATGKPQKRYTPTKDALKVNPKMQNFYTDKEPTLYNMSEGTGLAPAISSKIYEMPILGGLAGSDRLYKMRSNLKTTALNISKGVAENPRYAEGERKYIQGTLDVLPKLVDTPEAYQERLFAFDSYLQQLQEEALKTSFDKNMPADTVQNARAKAQDIYSVRSKLGVPLRIDDRNDPRFKLLPLGTKVLFGNRVVEVFE
jgi:hypothetical protein